MSTRPTRAVRWASVSGRAEPSSAEKDAGLAEGDGLPDTYLNDCLGLEGDWQTWVATRIFDQYIIPTEAIDLRLSANGTDGLVVANASGTPLGVKCATIDDDYSAIVSGYLAQVGLRIDTPQVVPDDADTALVWEVEEYDTHGRWTSGSLITVAHAGYYQVSVWAEVDMEHTTSGYATLSLCYWTGDIYTPKAKQTVLRDGAEGTDDVSLCCSAVFYVSVGGGIAAFLKQNTDEAVHTPVTARICVSKLRHA